MEQMCCSCFCAFFTLLSGRRVLGDVLAHTAGRFAGKWIWRKVAEIGGEISRDCDELCSWLPVLCSNTGNMRRCPRRRRQRDDDGRQLFEQICIHTPKSYNLPTSTRPANLSLCKKSQNCVLTLSQLMSDAEKRWILTWVEASHSNCYCSF